MPEDNTVMIEGARIIFRNFAGKEGMYNRKGDRNFAVVLDPKIAEELEADGWNVKRPKPRATDEEETVRDPHLQVSVSFNIRPPRIVLITSRGRTELSEDEVELLDWADIQNVDLIVRPYAWQVNGASGLKAYLKSMYVTIEEDALERKYSLVDGSGE